MRFIISLVGLSLFFCSCSQNTATDKNNKAEQSVVSSDSSSPQAAQPTRWLNNIPVFENFDDLAPLFNQRTDTTYVINFWATWCKPCVEELPYFEALHDRYSDQKLRVILVSLDFPRQLESKLIPFLEKHQLKSDVMVLTDPKQNEWIDKVNPEWGGAIPVTMIYKADKKQFIGEQIASPNELNTLIESFL